MDGEYVDDETIINLRNKLSGYKEKLKKVEDLRDGGNSSTNIITLIQKLEKAIEITTNLIEKRMSELEVEKKSIISKYQVGDYVFAKKPGCTSWYIGIVEKVMLSESVEGNEYVVRFVGDDPTNNNIVSPNAESLSPYRLPRKYLKVGVTVLAVWDKDQKYYKANIDKLDDIGWVWVRFKGYSGVQKTREENIRLEGSFGKELYGEETNRKVKLDNRSGKKRKRKEEKEKGKLEKKRKLDNLLSKRKKSWKDFMNKGSKKKMKGFQSQRKAPTLEKNPQPMEIMKKPSEKEMIEFNRKRKGAVIQRPVRKTIEAENVLEEMEHLKDFSRGGGYSDRRRGGSRGRNEGYSDSRPRDGYNNSGSSRSRYSSSSNNQYSRNDQRPYSDYSREDYRRREDRYDRRNRYTDDDRDEYDYRRRY